MKLIDDDIRFGDVVSFDIQAEVRRDQLAAGRIRVRERIGAGLKRGRPPRLPQPPESPSPSFGT